MSYFVESESGVRTGPLTGDQVRELVRAGSLTPLHWICGEDGRRSRAGKIPGLFPHVADSLKRARDNKHAEQSARRRAEAVAQVIQASVPRVPEPSALDEPLPQIDEPLPHIEEPLHDQEQPLSTGPEPNEVPDFATTVLGEALPIPSPVLSVTQPLTHDPSSEPVSMKRHRRALIQCGRILEGFGYLLVTVYLLATVVSVTIGVVALSGVRTGAEALAGSFALLCLGVLGVLGSLIVASTFIAMGHICQVIAKRWC